MITVRPANTDERKNFYRTGDGPKGAWFPLSDAGRKTATLNCPNCGKFASLQDHQIAADGTITPSVVCPYGCGFHDMVRLLGWEA